MSYKKKSSELQVFTKEEENVLYAAAWNDFQDGHNSVQCVTVEITTKTKKDRL